MNLYYLLCTTTNSNSGRSTVKKGSYSGNLREIEKEDLADAIETHSLLVTLVEDNFDFYSEGDKENSKDIGDTWS